MPTRKLCFNVCWHICLRTRRFRRWRSSARRRQEEAPILSNVCASWGCVKVVPGSTPVHSRRDPSLATNHHQKQSRYYEWILYVLHLFGLMWWIIMRRMLSLYRYQYSRERRESADGSFSLLSRESSCPGGPRQSSSLCGSYSRVHFIGNRSHISVLTFR